MRIFKQLMVFTLLASMAGCFVEERPVRHPYRRDRATVIIR